MSKTVRVFIPVVSFIFYLLLFACTSLFASHIAGIWALLPLVVSGWFLGMGAALLTGLVTLPSTYIIYHLLETPIADSVTFYVFGATGTIFLGVATGWVKGLLDQSSDRARQQASQQQDLHAEISRRMQAESALRQINDNLENTVAERTVQLKQANERLHIELGERRRAEEETALKNKQLTMLNKLGQALYKLGSRLEILERTSELISHVYDNHNLYIAIYDDEKKQLTFPIYYMEGTKKPSKGRPLRNGLTEWVIRTRAPLCIPAHMPEALEERKIALFGRMSRSYLGVPMPINDHEIGVIAVQDYENENVYDAGHIELLSTIAAHAGTAIENARLYAAVQQELAERNRAEEQLFHNAFHDPLTGLPNRALFMDRLERAMERTKRHKDYAFAVIYMDLDRFKVVNDSLGHNIGDQLLTETARRLSVCLRDGDTVARLGGDEFVILADDIQDVQDATRIANRIQHDVGLPCRIEEQNVFVSVSMGIVLSASRYEHSQDILRDADNAMYRAKALGRGRFEVFDTAMLDHAISRLELENDLRGALERREFLLYYQPIVSVTTRRIIGFEALLRWQHPRRGLIPPAEFIPIAEETGLIIPIGLWVMREACVQISEWQAQFPMTPPLSMSINLSAKQFGQPDLIQQIKRALGETGLDAACLNLELTESMIIEDAAWVNSTLEQLCAVGLRVQIDDFGTGYSSLGYLHRLPIDTLKIDRTFINRLDMNTHGPEIVRTILMLAHDLGMKVIAEGVETTDQLAKLNNFKCEYAQGFLFAKPANSRVTTALISSFLASPVAENMTREPSDLLHEYHL